MILSEKELNKLHNILTNLLSERERGCNFDTVIVPKDTFQVKFCEFEGIQFRESDLITEDNVVFVNSKAYLSFI